MPPETTTDQRTFYLGVDGGGTKTSCYLGAVGPSGQLHVLGRGVSSGSNPRTAGMDAAVAAIVESVRLAREEAGAHAISCERALLAIAGTLDLSFRRELAARLSAAGVAIKCDVVPDLIPLLQAETGETQAMGIISGTGSVGIGRGAVGQIVILGGWGPLIGDDGSGFAIGKQALRHALNSLEVGDSDDPLVAIVCRELNVNSAAEILNLLAASEDQRGLIARLTKPVIELATQEETIAESIVHQAVCSLVDLVERVRRRIEVASDDCPPLTISGGLFQSGDYFREKFVQELTHRSIAVQLRPLQDPTQACLELAASGQFAGELNILR